MKSNPYKSMGFHIFSITYLLTSTLVLVASTFADDNPIRVVSNGHQSSVHHQDLHSMPNFLPSNQIEAIYQFGDSISDTGNCIQELPSHLCGNKPYGITSFNTPTGRCSDGLLIIDYFAKFWKLPFLDPYLKKDGNFNHGVNFAVAGATALNCSTLAIKHIAICFTNSSLLVQLDWFKSHLNSICSTQSDCKKKLAKALVVMGEIGGNDYNTPFWERKKLTEIYKIVPEVIQIIKDAIQEVINLGVIRIIVPGNFPLGCMTIYLNLFRTNDSGMYDEFQCLNYLNDFAIFHNEKLQEAIRKLQKDNPNVTIVYADYFSAFQELLRQATSLGFDKDLMEKPCCSICQGFGNTVCENPYKYINWDEVHLTQHSYQIMAKWLIKYSLRDFYSNMTIANV